MFIFCVVFTFFFLAKQTVNNLSCFLCGDRFLRTWGVVQGFSGVGPDVLYWDLFGNRDFSLTLAQELVRRSRSGTKCFFFSFFLRVAYYFSNSFFLL